MNLKITTFDSILFFAKFSVWFSAIALLTLISVNCSLTLVVAISPILGLLFAHGIELQHQALHYTGVKSKSFSRLIGSILGAPTANSFTAYQVTHLWHHTHLGRPTDKEFFDHSFRKFSLFSFLLRSVSPVRALRNLRSALSLEPTETVVPVSTANRAKIRIEVSAYRCMLVILLVGSLSSTMCMHGFVLWITGYWCYSFWHMLIEFPEHYGCDTGCTDVLKNTRSISARGLASYITNFNNLHVEHHLYPSVPMQNLPELHQKLQTNISFKNGSYSDFYAKVIRGEI